MPALGGAPAVKSPSYWMGLSKSDNAGGSRYGVELPKPNLMPGQAQAPPPQAGQQAAAPPAPGAPPTSQMVPLAKLALLLPPLMPDPREMRMRPDPVASLVGNAAAGPDVSLQDDMMAAKTASEAAKKPKYTSLNPRIGSDAAGGHELMDELADLQGRPREKKAGALDLARRVGTGAYAALGGGGGIGSSAMGGLMGAGAGAGYDSPYMGAAAGALAFNPRFKGLAAGKPGLNAATHSVQNAVGLGGLGSVVDEGLQTAGLQDPNARVNFSRLGVAAGAGTGALSALKPGTGLGRLAAHANTAAGDAMAGTMRPIAAMGRRVANPLIDAANSARNSYHGFYPAMGGQAPPIARQWAKFAPGADLNGAGRFGRNLSVGTLGLGAAGAGVGMVDSHIDRKMHEGIGQGLEAFDQYAGEAVPQVANYMGDRVKQEMGGMATGAMSRLDPLLASMGMDPSSLSLPQKLSLLSSPVLGAAGLGTGSLPLTGLAGLAAAYGSGRLG